MKYKIRVIFLIVICLSFCGCHFFTQVKEEVKKDYNASVTGVSLDKNILNIDIGESEFIKLTLTGSEQNKCTVSWEYDKTMISVVTDKYGVIVTGLKAGGTYIKASCNGIIATCLISVLSNGEVLEGSQYIYSSVPVLEMESGQTRTISVSLYGGTVAEMEDFTFSVKDPTIASISSARNNCIVTALKSGSTQIVAQHPLSEYEYSFIVFVGKDVLSTTFITTKQNVLTINKNEKDEATLSVSLTNPKSLFYKNGFTFEVEEGKENIIQISSNAETCLVTALNPGMAKIKVKHEDALYDLDIIVRVVAIVKNVYVSVEPSSVIVKGNQTSTIYASLKNYEDFVNPDDFIFGFTDPTGHFTNFSDEIPVEIAMIADISFSGNACHIKGKKNGMFKISVGHPKAEYKRNVLVILEEQLGSAIDSSMYITTTDNYVQTKVGSDDMSLSVRLIGGDVGDDKDFDWYIDGVKWYKTGTDSVYETDIAKIQYVDGTASFNASSRTAVSSGKSVEGKLIITPIGEGSLRIKITHPRCLYDCDITVKVFSSDAWLADPISISVKDDSTKQNIQNPLKLTNGTSLDAYAVLSNATAPNSDSFISWKTDSSKVSLSQTSGKFSTISASGSGNGQTYIYVDYDAQTEKAYSPYKILVLTGDTLEEIESMKYLSSNNQYIRLNKDSTFTVNIDCGGNVSEQDKILWSVDDLSIISLDSTKTSVTNSGSAYSSSLNITGLKQGKTTLSASIEGYNDGSTLSFDVTVLSESEPINVVEVPKYLTTRTNTIVLEKIGDTTSVSVQGVNIEQSDIINNICWTQQTKEATDEFSPVFEIMPETGSESVTVEALQKGKATFTVDVPGVSNNQITISAKCGDLYEWSDGYVVYITSESDVYNFTNGTINTIACSLVNTTEKGSFSWSVIEGNDVIEITGLTSGVCNVKAINPGQAVIKVSNSLCDFGVDKEILINIGNTEEELRGFNYLTTDDNVITISEGSSVSVSVNIENAKQNVITGYEWNSSNQAIANVTSSGSVASVYGRSCGTSTLTVTNYENCDYPLEIIVNVVDPIAAVEDPYIDCNNIVTCYKDGDTVTLSASLIGGTESDSQNFSWVITDSAIARLYSSNNSAQITGLKEGITQIVVSHPKASLRRTVLVIVEPKKTVNYNIKTNNKQIETISPSLEYYTYSVSLENGSADDAKDFRWWADSYDCINMNYTGNSCIVEPICSGYVNLHVSHPKAANQIDFILKISDYTVFSFETNNISIDTGTDAFINMEVPALNYDYYISYKSSNPSLLSVYGKKDTCVIRGDASALNGEDVKSCTVTASLQNKAGTVMATAETLVVVNKKDNSKAALILSGDPSVITLNKGAVKTVSIALSDPALSPESINWQITNDRVVEFYTSKRSGGSLQLQALESGSTTVTVTHPECQRPLTFYIVVAGVADTVVELNYEQLNLYVGENTATLSAKVHNGNNDYPEWSLYDVDFVYDETLNRYIYDESTLVKINETESLSFSTNGTKALLYPQKPGMVLVGCENNGASAFCFVSVNYPPKLEFFVYNNEQAKNSEKTISDLNVIPGEIKVIHYRTYPAKVPLDLQRLVIDDLTVADADDKGYGFYDTTSGIQYDEDVGTVYILAKPNVGTNVETTKMTFNTVKTADYNMHNQTASFLVSNGYNYSFELNKTSINVTPKEVVDNPGILDVQYSVRPACGVVRLEDVPEGLSVQLKNPVTGVFESVTLKKEVSDYSSNNNATYIYEIEEDKHYQIDKADNIATGIIRFVPNAIDAKKKQVKECGNLIRFYAINRSLVASGNNSNTEEVFSENKTLKIQISYNSHSFNFVITKQVPTAIKDFAFKLWGTTKQITSLHSSDKEKGNLVLGDGETVELALKCNEENCVVNIKSIVFKPVGETDSNIERFKTEKNFMDDKRKLVNSNTKFSNVAFLKPTNNGGILSPANTKGTCSTEDGFVFTMSHGQDYGSYFYKTKIDGNYQYFGLKKYLESEYLNANSNTFTDVYTSTDKDEERAVFFDVLSENATDAELYNSTCRMASYVGNIVITYTNYSTSTDGKDATFNIPVYLEVRNTPCTEKTDYYNISDF